MKMNSRKLDKKGRKRAKKSRMEGSKWKKR